MGHTASRKKQIFFVAFYLALAIFILLNFGSQSYGQTDKAPPPPASGNKHWNANEHWAWHRILKGEKADFNQKFNEAPDPENRCEWSDQRRIRPAFLEEILTDRTYSEKITSAGVMIIGAWIREPLDLSSVNLSFPLWIDKSRVEGAISFEGAVLKRLLSLDGNCFLNTVNLNQIKSSDSLVLKRSVYEQDLTIRGTTAWHCRLSKARVKGSCTIEDSLFSGNFISEDSFFSSLELRAVVDGELHLYNAVIDGDFDLIGSTIKNGIFFDDIKVSGKALWSSLNAPNGMAVIGGSQTRMNSINLSGASTQRDISFFGNVAVDGDVKINGARVDGGITMGGAGIDFKQRLEISFTTVKETLNLSGSTFRQVRIIGSNISGLIYGSDANFDSLNITDTNVGTSLYLADAVFSKGPLTILRSEIGRHLYLAGIDMKSNDVSMHSTKTNGHVIMSNIKCLGAIDMRFMDIGGYVKLSGSHLKQLDLSNTTIDNALFLWDKDNGFITWEPSSEKNKFPILNLRNTTARLLQDHPKAWPRSIDLLNFGYRFFGSSEAIGSKNTISNRPERWFVEWLEKSGDYENAEPYHKQAYLHLYKILKGMGYNKIAKEIFIAHNDRKKDSPCTKPGQKIWLWCLDFFTSYGQEMWRLSVAVFILILSGAAVLKISGEGRRHRMPYGISLSIDRTIPLISLDKAYDDIKLQGITRYWFYFLQVAGYFFATLLVASVINIFSNA
ncbi:MAG TPA: hypothetical protein DHV36_05735 [Desulfobacteraceae bacterium]|nr:hypothetical protein [Desulfobacteraceae bacterium]